MRGDLSNIESNPPVRALLDVMLIDDATEDEKWVATDSAANIIQTLLHVLGTKGISFDKVGGTTDAGITRSFAPIKGGSRFSATDLVEITLLVPGGTNLDEMLLRLGTNISNYAQWVIPSADISTGEWQTRAVEIGSQDIQSQVGAGLDLDNIRFAQFIIRTQASGQTFVGAVFDSLLIRASR